MFGDIDLATIFSDFATPVSLGGVTVNGILDLYEDVFRRPGPGGFQTTQYLLRVPRPQLAVLPQPLDQVVIAAGPNVPTDFEPGTYTVKELPECKDPSIVDMILKGPIA
jgi:hypothetical protein